MRQLAYSATSFLSNSAAWSRGTLASPPLPPSLAGPQPAPAPAGPALSSLAPLQPTCSCGSFIASWNLRPSLLITSSSCKQSGTNTQVSAFEKAGRRWQPMSRSWLL